MAIFPRNRTWQAYALTVVSVVLAGAFRQLIQPILGKEYEFTTLFLAVVFAAWYGGLWPAILALGLECPVAVAMHAFSHNSSLPTSLADVTGLALYIAMGLTVGVAGEVHQKAIADLNAESAKREKLIRELETEVGRRRAAELGLRAHEAQLVQLNCSLESRVRERTRELSFALDELESFLHSIAHDMRAPLRAVNVACRVMTDRQVGYAEMERRESLESVKRAVKFMDSFLDDLLGYARLARAPVQMAVLDLSALLTSMVKEMRKTDRDVQISIQADMELVSDMLLMRSLFRELIDNSRKFRKPDSPSAISVQMWHNVDADEITVSDQGIGLDMQFASKIFEPFQKLHAPNLYPGTGIGLAKAKRIVERLGGTIWVESELGAGCNMHIRFPF